MKTKSEKFVEEKRESWKQLLNLIRKINKKGIRELDNEEAELFPRLYRKTCQDLAEARMLELSPDVLEYLNNLTGQAHHLLYFIKPLSRKELSDYFMKILPFSLVKNIRFIVLSLILFWGSAAGTYLAVLESPQFAERFVSAQILDYIEDMYREPVSTGRTAGQKAQMASFYIQHNISIAFLCFATGIFLSLGSIYFLLYNGIFLGSIVAYLTASGMGPHIWEFITAHSFLELNAIAISGAAGIKLGISLLKSWQNYSLDYLENSKGDILSLVSASAIMLFFAALIEGNVSPSALQYQFKLAVMFISVIVVAFYFFIYPFNKRGGK